MADSLAAALKEIRERPEAMRNGDPWDMLAASQRDERRLLAALDAALALADALTAPHAPPRTLYEGGYFDAEQQLGKVFRERIARALLGEDRTDV